MPHENPHQQWVKARLTPKQRDEIRQRYLNGETAASLATEFGLSYSTVASMVPRRGEK
jgi:DNA-directed RNA polymerase specialized sigma24 family protein